MDYPYTQFVWFDGFGYRWLLGWRIVEDDNGFKWGSMSRPRVAGDTTRADDGNESQEQWKKQ